MTSLSGGVQLPYPWPRPDRIPLKLREVVVRALTPLLDNVKLLSEDGLFGPDGAYFPSMGELNGQDPNGGLRAFIRTLQKAKTTGRPLGASTRRPG